MIAVFLTVSANVSAQNIKTDNIEDIAVQSLEVKEVVEINPQAGQITRQTIEMPSQRTLSVGNSNATPVDVDLSAFDLKGKEVGRETIRIKAGDNLTTTLGNVFSQLALNELSVVEIQTSVLSAKAEPGSQFSGQATENAYQLPVGFFSQRQSPWNSYMLGNCSGDTIGSSGCAITSIAMAMTPVVTNLDPGVLNDYLKNNGGYVQDCLVVWANAAGIDGSGGFTYYGSSTVGSAANLKSLIDSGKFSVVKSTRFSSHYGVIIGYINNGTALSDFYYLDPWDLTAQFHYVGDGWVSSSSLIQRYR
jgi:hypothetical protein